MPFLPEKKNNNNNALFSCRLFIHSSNFHSAVMDNSTVCRGKNYGLCLQEANNLVSKKDKKAIK